MIGSDEDPTHGILSHIILPDKEKMNGMEMPELSP